MPRMEQAPHWTNPWKDAVPVPLEELAELLAGGTVTIVENGEEKVVPHDETFLLSHWRSYGENLDAYLLWSLCLLSAGVRYGNDGPDYLTPYVRDQTRARKLWEKYRR